MNCQCNIRITVTVQYKLAVTFTGVSGIKHRCTSPTTAFQCSTLPVAGTCDLPATINWLFYVSAVAPLVVAPSLLLVPQSGIHCLTVCAIQLLDQSSFDALVCLLLAFRWQCAKRCFTYSRYTNVHLLTYPSSHRTSVLFGCYQIILLVTEPNWGACVWTACPCHVKPATCWSQAQHRSHYTLMPQTSCSLGTKTTKYYSLIYCSARR